MLHAEALSDRLQAVIDRDEIRALMLRYARGVNRQDWDLVLSCYHPDAVENHLPFWGPGSPRDFVVWVRDQFTQYQSVQTFIGNQLIEVYGNLAWGEIYGMNIHRKVDPDGRVFHLSGYARYSIRYELRDGQWRFAEREFFTDTGSFELAGGLPVANSDGTITTIQFDPTGHFDPTDGSYQLRDRIRRDAGV